MNTPLNFGHRPWIRTLGIAALLAAAPLAQAYQTINGQLYDGSGQEIQLRGVNWFGFETDTHSPHGLWARNYKDMIGQMKSLGFNAVRLPFCPASLNNATASGVDFGLNPDLQGLNATQMMDRIIDELDQQDMYILLDHHRPDCEAISQLWYTDRYSEDQWLDDLARVADRYKDVPHVIGVDLKNEPHGAATWGTGNPATDWNLAAERAADRVLDAAPQMLVFVAGVESSSQCGSGSGSWWGGLLSPINCAGLSIPSQKLVLSPHVYGPDVYDQPYFSHSDFPDNLPPIWEEQWGFAASQGYTVVPGEFGGRYGHGGEPTDRAWQNNVVDYMISKGITSSFYWSWNPNSGDTGGILQDDWQSVWTDKVELLERLWAADGSDQDSDPDEGTGGGNGDEGNGDSDGDATPDSSLQATRFATRTTGGADSDGGWNVWSNGYIENGFAWSGSDQVNVELRGAYADGWPEMKLYAGDRLVETRTIASSDWQTYGFDVQGVTGNQPLRIEFINDYYQNGQDRNLHVRNVSVTSASNPGTDSPTPDGEDTAGPDTPDESGQNRVSLRAEHSGQCLSVADSSTAAGANLTQADCLYGTSQQFDIVGAEDGSVALRPVHSAQALALDQGSTQNGANIMQADWSGADSQLWSLQEDASGVVTLRPKNAPGSCLGVSRFSQANGANVHLWRCYGGANQKWRLLPQ